MAVPNRVVHRTVRTAVLSSGRGGRLQSCVVGAAFGLERQAVDQQQLSQRLLGADGHALHSRGHSHRGRHGGLLRRLSHVGPVLRRCVQVDRRGAAVQHHLPQSSVCARRAVLHRVERMGPDLRLLQQEAIPLLV